MIEQILQLTVMPQTLNQFNFKQMEIMNITKNGLAKWDEFKL